MANSNSSSGGIGFVGVLTTIFIVLKLVGVIDWTWFWVLSPMIISFAFVIVVAIIIFIISNL